MVEAVAELSLDDQFYEVLQAAREVTDLGNTQGFVELMTINQPQEEVLVYIRLFHQFIRDDPTENVAHVEIIKPIVYAPDILTEDLRNIDLDNLSPNQMEALKKAPTQEQYVLS